MEVPLTLTQVRVKEVSKEEAIRSLVNAGILDTSGNLTKPYEDLAIVSPQ